MTKLAVERPLKQHSSYFQPVELNQSRWHRCLTVVVSHISNYPRAGHHRGISKQERSEYCHNFSFWQVKNVHILAILAVATIQAVLMIRSVEYKTAAFIDNLKGLNYPNK